MKNFILFLILIIIIQCELFSPDENNDTRQLIVNGTIFSGQPITGFTLSREISPEDTSRNAISNATIELISAEKVITLEENENTPGKYNQSTSAETFNAGEKVTVIIQYEKEELSAEFTMPDTVTGLAVNYNYSGIHRSIDIKWNSDNDTIWYYKLEKLTDNFGVDDDSTSNEFITNKWLEVNQVPQYSIHSDSLGYSGAEYRFHVCRLDEHYKKLITEDLLENLLLTDLPSNVNNGLGLVAGFGYSYIDFKITEAGE